jgi:hypothetical protein
MKIHDGPKVWVPYKDQTLQWMFIFSSLSPCKSSMATLRSVDIRPPSLLLSGMIPFPRRERLSLPFFLFFPFFFSNSWLMSVSKALKWMDLDHLTESQHA